MTKKIIMLINIKLWVTAFQELGIPYEILHPTQNVIRIKLEKCHYFTHNTTPFNDQSSGRILKDKDYTFHVLKGHISMPKTISFLSPFCDKRYHEYLRFENLSEIEQEILSIFSLPVIIKRNSGASGDNVFLCQNSNQIKIALEKIFNVDNKNYDYIALAQEYINIVCEYRAVFFNQKLVLLYQKDNSNASFVGNLSPLHWEGAEAKIVTEAKIIQDIERFVQPVFAGFPIKYGGFDIAQDNKGQYWLIEINSSPFYGKILEDQGAEIVVNMFKKILIEWMAEKK